MHVVYKNTKVYYQIYGNGNVPILFLHGWGGSSKSFDFICEHLKFDYKAIFVDFPPFGNSEEPKCDFTIFDYCEIVEQILKVNNILKPITVGHSFGGRVAILLASKNLTNSLILTASAGMKPKRSIKYYYKVCKHKLLKKIGITSNVGSVDYKQLSPNMKKTFSNIVSTFLEEYAIHINVPTILFWGKKDKDTPFYMAKRLKKLIKDSEIIAFENSEHFCYLDNLNLFVAIINEFAKNY